MGSNFLPFSSLWLHYIAFPYCGFWADISIDILTDISIDIFIDMFIDISIDILVDISIDMFIDNFIDISIDKEEGGGRKEGRKEGVDFSLNSNNPTPEGGEQFRSPPSYKFSRFRIFPMFSV